MPDPGLTDLIAAHREGDYGRFGRQTCKCGWTGDSHPAHVALVVEQHTNRRIAELEAELAEAKDDKFYARVELNADMQWKARAEKAEATIARVENALPEASTGFNPTLSEYDKGWERGQQSVAQYVRSAIAGDGPAALEGEQQ